MLRITTAADLIAAIPGLLGFVPTESIVVIGVNDDKVAMIVRHDVDEVGEVAEQLADMLRINSVTTAHVLAIDENDEAGEAAARTMSAALRGTGIEADRCIVTARCDQPAPYRDLISGVTGTSGDYRDSPLSAEQVVTGAPVASTRAEMRARLATTEPVDTEGIDIQPDVATKAVVSAVVFWPTEIPRELSAQVAVMIRRHTVYRDAFLRTAAYDVRSAAQVFTELARPLRGRDRANVLTIAAAMYYLAGNGAMAGIILDAIALNGSVPALANLLNQALRSGVGPHLLRDAIIPEAALADQLFGGHFPTPEDFA